MALGFWGLQPPALGNTSKQRTGCLAVKCSPAQNKPLLLLTAAHSSSLFSPSYRSTKAAVWSCHRWVLQALASSPAAKPQDASARRGQSGDAERQSHRGHRRSRSNPVPRLRTYTARFTSAQLRKRTWAEGKGVVYGLSRNKAVGISGACWAEEKQACPPPSWGRSGWLGGWGEPN